MTAYWGQYVREWGRELEYLERDNTHADPRGEQVLGRILAGQFAAAPRGNA